MKYWKFAIPVLIAALFLIWYAFRPERLVLNQYVHEALPAAEGSLPEAIASGRFHSVLHSTEGVATIYRLGDGSRILRFTNFKTSNGPDVHIYMVAADDAKDNATVEHADFIDLGLIKGNIGDQNYNLSPVPLRKPPSKQVQCFMIFTECPISKLFITSCRPENGSKMNFATEPCAVRHERDFSAAGRRCVYPLRAVAVRSSANRQLSVPPGAY